MGEFTKIETGEYGHLGLKGCRRLSLKMSGYEWQWSKCTLSVCRLWSHVHFVCFVSSHNRNTSQKSGHKNGNLEDGAQKYDSNAVLFCEKIKNSTAHNVWASAMFKPWYVLGLLLQLTPKHSLASIRGLNPAFYATITAILCTICLLQHAVLKRSVQHFVPESLNKVLIMKY